VVIRVHPSFFTALKKSSLNKGDIEQVGEILSPVYKTEKAGNLPTFSVTNVKYLETIGDT